MFAYNFVVILGFFNLIAVTANKYENKLFNTMQFKFK